ncbi:tropomyosin-like [Xenia sp. Carnegie-2017]|uniref:tropomyosin-like n=1 Tax=Xenia sp. Carnegie-2017 TaxID=2897299 RepID=UPI001F04CEB3|nr:tropomyosin-like [Xenia sp. Carnegie-2017]XP_046859815.1 tropomyosin-like [Xenia sp. Carnegie-2017]
MAVSLQRVKDRLSKFKEEIDLAEEKEIQAKNDLLQAVERLEKTRNEVLAHKRRLVLVKDDLDKVNERIEISKAKLNHAEGRHGGDDELRQEFEITELERDEVLATLEEQCETAKRLKNEAHNVLVDGERKQAVLEEEVQRTDERIRIAEERVTALKSKVNDMAVEIRTLEDRDNDAAEREELTEEKLKFLEDQLREMDERADMGERDVAKIEIIIQNCYNELKTFDLKTQKVQHEVAEIGRLADMQLDEYPEYCSESQPEVDHMYENEQEPFEKETDDSE